MMNEKMKAVSQMYAIVAAVLQSDATPLPTKYACVESLKHILNDKAGPFQVDDELNALGEVISENANMLIKRINGELMIARVMGNIEPNLN